MLWRWIERWLFGEDDQRLADLLRERGKRLREDQRDQVLVLREYLEATRRATEERRRQADSLRHRASIIESGSDPDKSVNYGVKRVITRAGTAFGIPVVTDTDMPKDAVDLLQPDGQRTRLKLE